ncbi:KxYKxGKxW signal peptide domain-containing protein [Okeanomitos corallinicola]
MTRFKTYKSKKIRT